MNITNLPMPKVPIGIGTSMWSETDTGNFQMTFTLLHGITRVTKIVTLDKYFAFITSEENHTEYVVQLLADKAVLGMLHHLDEYALKQPILQRLENALATMKSRIEVYNSDVYSRSIATELKFFVEYIEGYVMGKPSNERYSYNVD